MKKEASKKILIVEDDLPTINAVSFKLKRIGISPEFAFSEEEALEKLKSGEYDLILVDLLLPDKDGFELISEIKTKGYSKNAKIVIFSNLDREENAERAEKLGVLNYFVKSDITINDLAAKIAEELKIK